MKTPKIKKGKVAKPEAVAAEPSSQVQTAPASSAVPTVPAPKAAPAPTAKPKFTTVVQTTANPFDNIGQKLATAALGISELDDIGTIEGMADAIKALDEAIPKTQESIKNSVVLLFEANKYIVAAQEQDVVLKAAGQTAVKERIAREVAAKYTVKAESCIKKVLGYTGVLLAIGVLEYIKTAMSLVPESFEQGRAVLKDLKDRGIINDSGTGPVIRVAYEKYFLATKFGFAPDDVKQISAAVDAFDRKQLTLLNEHRRQTNEAMKEESQIGLDEALSGKKRGKVLLRVPAECLIGDEGEEKWQGGGSVLFEFRSTGIRPLEATGKIEKSVKEAVGLGVEILWHMLDWGTEIPVRQFKLVGNDYVEDDASKKVEILHVPVAYELVPDIGQNLHLGHNEALQYAKKLMAVWHMLDRGIREVDKMKEQAEVKAVMEAGARAGMFEFFELNGAKNESKVTLLQMEGVYKTPTENLVNPFFLAERHGDTVTVVEVPPHLSKLLGEFVGKEFATNECPGELGGMMRRILSQQEMAARVADKPEEATTETAPDADTAEPAIPVVDTEPAGTVVAAQ